MESPRAPELLIWPTLLTLAAANLFVELLELGPLRGGSIRGWLLLSSAALLGITGAGDYVRRRRYRMRLHAHPLCRNCRYDLTGNESGVCPECGTPVRRPERA